MINFLNNFLFDPKKPQLPEHPLKRTSLVNSNDNNKPIEFNKFIIKGNEFQNRLRNFNANESNNSSTRHSRAIITYKDLDAQNLDG